MTPVGSLDKNSDLNVQTSSLFCWVSCCMMNMIPWGTLLLLNINFKNADEPRGDRAKVTCRYCTVDAPRAWECTAARSRISIGKNDKWLRLSCSRKKANKNHSCTCRYLTTMFFISFFSHFYLTAIFFINFSKKWYYPIPNWVECWSLPNPLKK